MRYLPLSDADRQAMLARIGAASIDDLFEDIPEHVRTTGLPNLPVPRALLMRLVAAIEMAAAAD